MRVVHTYNRLDPSDGGPPRVVVGLAEGLRALGHAVTLVSSDRAGNAAVARFLAESLSAPADRLVVRPTLPTSIGRPSRALARAVRSADVLHVHGLWAPVGLRAARIARRAGVPYVLTAHGMLHGPALAQRAVRKRLALRFLGYGELVRRAAALHFLNEDERAQAAALGLPARQVVIPNGVAPAAFAELPEPGRFRRRLPALGDAPFVLYLARLHVQKGPDLLAEAFARVARAFPGVHLVVAGPDQGARADFEARVARHRLQDRVHLLGPVFGPEKDELLRDAAVYCLPSRQEGFSIGITEALASGVPCVITAECHFPEVGTAGAGVVTALDAGALAAGLAAVLADAEAAAVMGARGRALVLERYTWPRIAARMVELYEAVR